MKPVKQGAREIRSGKKIKKRLMGDEVAHLHFVLLYTISLYCWHLLVGAQRIGAIQNRLYNVELAFSRTTL